MASGPESELAESATLPPTKAPASSDDAGYAAAERSNRSVDHAANIERAGRSARNAARDADCSRLRDPRRARPRRHGRRLQGPARQAAPPRRAEDDPAGLTPAGRRSTAS